MDLLIDPDTLDLVFEDGGIQSVDGDEAVAQRIRSTLLCYLDEWFFDRTHGTDYGEVMGLPLSGEDAANIVREAVYQEDAVKHIDALNIICEGRTLYISLSARLESGNTANVEVGG